MDSYTTETIYFNGFTDYRLFKVRDELASSWAICLNGLEEVMPGFSEDPPKAIKFKITRTPLGHYTFDGDYIYYGPENEELDTYQWAREQLNHMRYPGEENDDFCFNFEIIIVEA